MKSSSQAVLAALVTAVFWAQTMPSLIAAGQETSSQSTNSLPLDPGWPREITRNGVRLIYYQPQVDEWKDFRELRARFAFTLTQNEGKPVAGIEEVRGRTVADLQTRTVLIDNIEIVALRFPSLPDSEAAKMQDLMKSTFPGKPITVSLDRLIASVQANQENAKTVPVKTDPPPIFVSTEPAILLTVPEKPVLAPIKGVSLKFVLNTNWDLFFASDTSRYYLLAGKVWLASDALDGPWSLVKQLPAEFSKLPSDEGWDHVKKAIPATATAKAPKVFFSTGPAELIAFAGAPNYKKIEGTQLAYATNTDSWVFRNGGDGQIYYLVTGRWFRAPKLEGPWTYASNDLPADFQNIPVNSDAGEVLASVPDTPEAEDAVLLAQVPTSAVVNRAEAEAKVKVEYQGDPQFAPIEGTSLSYATNTSAVVIKVEDQYYLCADAVWFVASSPTGPWKTATEVPKAIYTIPPSSPVYHVTYVKVDQSNEKQVTYSYTAGYSGAYVAAAGAGTALVWGTGYYYPPYIYSAPVPIYYPHYATYGVAANYYPATGFYGVGGYAYGPYGGAGGAAWYNPSSGAYGRAYTNQYPYGGKTNAWGYNPSTNTSWTTQQSHNAYSQWGSSTIEHGGESYQTAHVATNYGRTAVAQGPNNLYAGHDGNVYKRDDNGDWSKYNNGQWQPVNPPQSKNSSYQNQQSNLAAQNQQGNSARNQQGNLSAQNQQNLGQSSPNSARTSASSGTPNQRTETKQTRSQTQQATRSSQARRSTGGENRPTDVTNNLDREASARKQGSEQVNLQQRRSRGNAATSNRSGSRGLHQRGRGRQ